MSERYICPTCGLESSDDVCPECGSEMIPKQESRDLEPFSEPVCMEGSEDSLDARWAQSGSSDPDVSILQSISDSKFRELLELDNNEVVALGENLFD